MTPNPADAVLAVRFYKREVQHEYQTTAQGRPISYMADFVRIEIPGNMLSIIDTFANDSHKQRFPVQWAQYQNEQNERDTPSDVQGTLLKDWPLLTAAQASELRHFKFYTVEQIANASDQQIQSIGMLVGMSPFSFREKAQAFLAQAKDSSAAMALAEEMKKRDIENADLRAQLQRQGEMLQKLMEAQEKRRPKKEAAEAE
jgi:hypothetical protein